MGKRQLFPVLVFGIVLVTALVAILIMNGVMRPFSLPQNTVVGHTTDIPLYDQYAPPYDETIGSTTSYVDIFNTLSGNNIISTVNVTNPDNVYAQYIYKTGYYSNGTTWTPFTFSTNPWTRDHASATFTATGITSGSFEYVVVFVCRKYSAGDQYVCGPRGTTADPTIKNWTLAFTVVPMPPVYTCPQVSGHFCAPVNTSPLLPEQNKTIYIPPFMGLMVGINTAPCPANQICYACNPGYSNISTECFKNCTTDADCGAGQVCGNGFCTTPATPPTYTCVASPNQFCLTPPSNGVLHASVNNTASCPSSQYCYKCDSGYANQSTSCVATVTCSAPCPSVNLVNCTADGKQQICSNLGACLNWSAPISCTGNGMTCLDNSCTSAFSTACTLTPRQACLQSQPANSMQNSSGLCVNGNTCYKCNDGYEYQNGQCVASCAPSNCPNPKMCSSNACVNPCAYSGSSDPSSNTVFACPNAQCSTVNSAATNKIIYGDDFGTTAPPYQAACCTSASSCVANGQCYPEGQSSDLSQTLTCINAKWYKCAATTDQGKQFMAANSHIWRCAFIPGTNSVKWTDMTTDVCMRASLSTPLSLSTCGSCTDTYSGAAAHTSVQAMIGANAYSLSTPQGPVYYARCCPNSSYCTDAEQCYPSGTAHPQFPTYKCSNGQWISS